MISMYHSIDDLVDMNVVIPRGEDILKEVNDMMAYIEEASSLVQEVKQ